VLAVELSFVANEMKLDCWVSLIFTMWRIPWRAAVVPNVEQAIRQRKKKKKKKSRSLVHICNAGASISMKCIFGEEFAIYLLD